MTVVKSMTGYGRAVETVNGREFTVEIRSVNNRYLDCSIKLPRLLSFAEDAVKQAVKASVSRGKVDVYVSQRSEQAADVQVKLNSALAASYVSAMRQMAEELKKLFREKGFRFYLDSPTNQQFVILENDLMERLQEEVAFSFWEKYDEDHTVVRFATSWSTTKEDIEQLRELLSNM